jgi:Protein kinase domain
MSPEIFQNKPYSYKSDVWALGCVLYEMTTLNHAFDANSLNGLAGKIVKGRYPPIHHKYSKFLRDLIAQMLLINPQQRPDLDQILRKPFIKKHIVNFFADIAARPSVGLGEGTMIVRAAAGAPINGVFSNDTNMLSLQKQLHVLDMTDAVQEALAPRDVPVDSLEAKKLVKEQAGALRREKEHKLMVESALEKLRLERESRTRQRSNPGVGAAVSPVPSGAAAVSYRVQGGQAGDPKGGAPLPSARREDPMRPAAARQPQSVRRPSDGPFQPSVEAARKEVRDRFALGGGVGAGARSSDQDKEKLKRNPSVTEERRILDERKRIEQEEKRKDDVRYEARIREEARLREDSRARGEAAAKQKLDQLRAQVDAVARRDQQREKERMRQKEEIEQLKRDKVELDRRSNERDRLREERREEERKKLEDGRKQQLDFMQEKSVPYSRDSSEYRAGQRADEKDPGSSVSAIAREKALLVQRRDTQARDKVDRADALRAVRVAEEDSRRARAIANNKMYPDSANYPGLGAPTGERGEERSKRAGERDTTMSVEELTQRLNDVNKGRNTR